MSKNNQIDEDTTYNLSLKSEDLKFVYRSCIEAILKIDYNSFHENCSISNLKICVTLFEQIKEIDPDWLIDNGFAYDRGFHLSWLEWMENQEE